MLEEGEHSTHFEHTLKNVDVAKIRRRTIELVLERWAGKKKKCMRIVRKNEFEGGLSRKPPLLGASA